MIPRRRLAALALFALAPLAGRAQETIDLTYAPQPLNDSQTVVLSAPMDGLHRMEISLDGALVVNCSGVDPCAVELPALSYGEHRYAASGWNFEGELVASFPETSFFVDSFFGNAFGLHPNEKFDRLAVAGLLNDLDASGMRLDIILAQNDEHLAPVDTLFDALTRPADRFGVMATIWGPSYELNLSDCGANCDCPQESPAFAFPDPERDAKDLYSQAWFLDRVEELVERYGGPCDEPSASPHCGRIRAWQIGNEVYGVPSRYFWGTVDQYVETLNLAAATIRAVDPNAIVVPGGIPGLRQGEGAFPRPLRWDEPHTGARPAFSDDVLCNLRDGDHERAAAKFLGYVWHNGDFDHYIDIHIYDTPETVAIKSQWVWDELADFGRADPVTAFIMSETANQKYTCMTHEQQAREVAMRYAFAIAGRGSSTAPDIVSAQWMGGLAHDYDCCLALGPDTGCNCPAADFTDSKALRCNDEQGPWSRPPVDRPSLATYQRLVARLGAHSAATDMVGSTNHRGEFHFYGDGLPARCLLWFDDPFLVPPLTVDEPCGFTGALLQVDLVTGDSVRVTDSVEVGANPILVEMRPTP